MACDLSVFTRAERAEHHENTRDVFAAIRDAREAVDGFSLSFPADPALRKRAVHWAECEKRCCPFFSFRFTDLPSSFALHVSGPEGAKEILRGVLDEHRVNVFKE